MNFGSTSRLGLSLYETSDPLEQWPGQSNADTEVVIRAVYRQVLGNAHIMDSERPVALESQFKNGELSVQDFVRALGKSALYADRFCDCPRFRQIELGFKHFLGRAPNSYAEMLAGTEAMDRGGFDALVDFFVDSDEFKSIFGSDTVPYIRGYKTEALSANAGFSYMFELLGGPASSDLGKASVLNAAIAQEKPKAISPVYKKPIILPYQPPAGFTIPTATPSTAPTPAPAFTPGVFKAVTTSPSADINVDASSRLGYAAYADSTPIEVWPGQSEAEKETAIRAVYKQVLGNIHIMDSERLTVPESQFKRGELSLGDFVRAVGKSDLYQSRFGDRPRFRKIELGYKHFLGRAPNEYSEMLTCTSILDRGSFDDLVDFFVDSDEFQTVFGQDTVPYVRGFTTEASRTAAGFPYTLQLLTGPASSDYEAASRLNASIISATPELPVSRYPVPTPSKKPIPGAVPGKVPIAPGGAQAPLLGEAAPGGFFGKILSFVEKLTGGGEAPAATEVGQVAASAAPEQPKEAFFLEPDEAISLGNVEYMRTPRTVRRSFPNVADPEKPLEFEAVVDAKKKVITPESEKSTGVPSALEPKKEEVKIPVVIAPFAPSVKVSESLKEFGTTASRAGKSGPYVSMSLAPEVSVRRKKDNSLDPFRKMAVAIRKGE